MKKVNKKFEIGKWYTPKAKGRENCAIKYSGSTRGWGFWHYPWDEDDISFDIWFITDVEGWKEASTGVVEKLVSTLSEEQKGKLK